MPPEKCISRLFFIQILLLSIRKIQNTCASFAFLSLSSNKCHRIFLSTVFLWLTSTSSGSEITIFNSGPSHTRIKSPYCLINLTITSKFSVKMNQQKLFILPYKIWSVISYINDTCGSIIQKQ